ncbi:MAG: hypothetical protein GY710_16955 [Desulfobacteraceae bacterium]|nr:hypothetical protein [Desulfobacteraceae bacterium]
MSDSSDEIQIAHIPLDKIDLADARYQISGKDEDITALALSIKETGLTSLPFVKVMGDFYIVVTGFKRLKALVHNNYAGKVVCQTISRAPEVDCAVRAVCDNAFQRELTPAQLIKSILLLSQFMEPDLMASRSLGIFNTRLNAVYIKDLQAIGNLPQQVFELLDDNRLCLKSARKISRITPDLADCFIGIFSAIKTSSSKQMEIIKNFLEIAAREDINPRDLYLEKPIREILFHDSKDLGLKGNLLRNYLMERRFPSLSKKRRDIRQKINSLKLGSGIKLTVPENFEGTTYCLCLDFKTKVEFTDKVASLNGVSTNPVLEDILKR